MYQKEKIKKYAVEYYDMNYPSGGGYWRIDAYENINDAISQFMRRKKDNVRFYIMQKVPIHISFGKKIKSFIFNIKWPKHIKIE